MPKRREYQICPSGGSIGRRFGVDLESASFLSCRIGVSETAEYWEKVQRTSARPHVYGDNKSQVTNSSRPELTLKKKCNSICYHAICESVAMGETLLTHIRTGENLVDFVTKTTSGAKRRKLVRGVVHDICDDFQQ